MILAAVYKLSAVFVQRNNGAGQVLARFSRFSLGNWAFLFLGDKRTTVERWQPFV
jgi:hypothetical protein